MRMSKGVRIFMLAALIVLFAVLMLQPDRKSRLVERLGTGLSDAHSAFTARQLLEIYEGEDRTGAVRDLTNFNWDRVCVYPPYAYFGPDGRNPAEHPFYEVAWSLDASFSRIVFSEADAVMMVLKIPSNPVNGPAFSSSGYCHVSSARYLFRGGEPKAENDPSREAPLPAYRSFFIVE
tara:strand:- start:27463 stop:27996 length:534 start_codon:yes stop_codon:yes gene_type:complete